MLQRCSRYCFGLGLILAALLLPLNGLAHGGGDESQVQAGHSGTYLTPGRDGEGWLVEVLNETTALIIWFSFTPQDSDTGIQAWFGGVGMIDGNRIVVSQANITSGAVFGDDFDPDDVVRTLWGSIEFAFDGRNSGTMTFSGLPEYGSGSRPFVRLSGIVGLPFGVAPEELPAPASGQPGVTGTWVDFSHDGEGWFLQEVAPGVLVLAWFTFNDVGQQVWVIGTGVLQDGTAVFDNVRFADGTDFGDAFDEDQVNRMRWGSIRIVFEDCNTAILTYNSDFEAFGEGQLNPVRLSSLKNLNCAFPAPANVAVATWRVTSNTGPTLSELPSATIDDAIYVAGGYSNGFFSERELWRYQPAINTWTRLQDLPAPRDHSMMVAFEGSLYFIGGFLSSGVGGNPQPDNWRYDPQTDAWTILTSMPVARAAGGAAVIGQHIYVTGGTASRLIHRYSPADDSWETLNVSDPFERDHSAVVAFRGELWILGGRDNVGRANTGVYIFDPVTATGRIGPAMSVARSGFAAAVAGGHIMVTGGENFMPGGVVGTTEAFNPETNSWQTIANIPIPVHGITGTEQGGNFYVLVGSVALGGISNIGQAQVLEIPPP